MIMPSRLTIGLGIALAASLVGNGFLFWQWAQAKPECENKRTGDVLAGVTDTISTKLEKDATSAAVTRESDIRTTKAIASADTFADQDQEVIRNAYKTQHPDPVPGGPCVVLRPAPDRVQHAIDAAVERANR